MTKPIQITIIATDFHKEVADYMIKTAKRAITKHQAQLMNVFRVPGSYEIPLITQSVITNKKPGAIVILSYIEKGCTMHGEVMGHVVHDALIKLQLKHSIPMGLGIIGPGATRKQAEERKKKSAQGAVRAAIKSWHSLQGICSP